MFYWHKVSNHVYFRNSTTHMEKYRNQKWFLNNFLLTWWFLGDVQKSQTFSFYNLNMTYGKLLYWIPQTPSIDASSQVGKTLPKPKGYIKFENVNFHYPSRSAIPILRNISFEVQPGQSVALVGSSGCGKSTIVNLLLRFYQHNSGKVILYNYVWFYLYYL